MDRQPTIQICRASPNQAAFSLVELLLVIAILVILFALAGVAFNNVGEGSALTGAGQTIRSQLALAAQHAAAQNEVVAVRIYSSMEPPRLAMVTSDAGNDRFLGRAVILPQSIAFDTASQFSSVLGLDAVTESASAPSGLAGEQYREVRIRPDGRTSLSMADEPWTLTVKGRNSQPDGTKPAPNFITVVIDPLTAATRGFQP